MSRSEAEQHSEATLDLSLLRGLSSELSRPGGWQTAGAVDEELSLRALPRGPHAASGPWNGNSKPGGGKKAAMGRTPCTEKAIG